MTLDLEIHSDDPSSQLSFEQLLYLLNKRLAAGNIQDAGVVAPLIADLSITTPTIANLGVTTPKRQLVNSQGLVANVPTGTMVGFGFSNSLGVFSLVTYTVRGAASQNLQAVLDITDVSNLTVTVKNNHTADQNVTVIIYYW